MKDKIINYRKSIDLYIENNKNNKTEQSVIDNHLIQIGFFQHEREVHLIVLVLFALMAVILLCAISLTEANLLLLVLEALIDILLIPYVFHYYMLENETQKMYDQYDKLLKNL